MSEEVQVQGQEQLTPIHRWTHTEGCGTDGGCVRCTD